MPLYSYVCPAHGEVLSGKRADFIRHECGAIAKRQWQVHIDAASARSRGRWDPQVGAWVNNEREFDSLLAEGRDKVSAELNMDVKLARVDSRDQEGLAEAHGQPLDQRLADQEAEKRTRRDMGIAP